MRTLLIVMLFALGCSASAAEPFVLRVQSTDVQFEAVDELRIELDPVPREFYAIDADLMARHAEAGVTTHVSAAGEFVLTLERSWLQGHQVETTAGPFAVDIPLWTDLREDVATITDQDDVTDPFVIARAFRSDAQITDDDQSRTFVPWPLPSGAQTIVYLKCQEEGTATIPECAP